MFHRIPAILACALFAASLGAVEPLNFWLKRPPPADENDLTSIAYGNGR